jgi:hypothetical protein
MSKQYKPKQENIVKLTIFLTKLNDNGGSKNK